MNIAILCVLIAGIQPIIWGLCAKGGSAKGGTAYDNAAPRPLMDSYSGWPARANWAMQNAYEAFPLFAAAVVLAMMSGVNQAVIDQTAVIYVVLRFAFGFLYMANLDKLRSLVWVLAMAAVIRLFVLAI